MFLSAKWEGPWWAFLASKYIEAESRLYAEGCFWRAKNGGKRLGGLKL
jgi:hypothetical protein